MNRQEMQQLVERTDVTAERIRILFDEGVSRSDIARFLEISYQHVYNVLKRSNRLGNREASSPEGTVNIVQVEVENGERISLPREYVNAQRISAGDVLICREEAGNLVIMSRSAAVEALRETVQKKMPEEAALLEALLSAPNRAS